MDIKLQAIRPDRRITRVTASTVSFSVTGLVRLSVQAGFNTGWTEGKYVAIYLDANNNLYIGEGQDFQLRPVKSRKTVRQSLGFNNKRYIFDLAKKLDWPLGNGKLTHITYDLLPEPLCVNGLTVYKLV